MPVPETRDELVKLRKPDWGRSDDPSCSRLKATWIGHASWLIETPKQSVDFSFDNDDSENASSDARGVRIIVDPVFSERTSPISFLGPKRYTPTPCSLEEVPEVDLCLISHSHYDHLDLDTINKLYARNPDMHFLCGLGNAKWFHSCGIQEGNVAELDWWQGVQVDAPGVGSVKLICTPAQHFSGRGLTDKNSTLWCSWVVEEAVSGGSRTPRKLYFAGDTGYRTVFQAHPTKEQEEAQPVCPAFKDIGKFLGPFDLALLPIGLCTPRDVMSAIHCAPEDTVHVHTDVNSKRSIGMHYGTFRGGISAQYEDVRYPPRRWKEVCEEAGLQWGEEVGLCDIGETVLA